MLNAKLNLNQELFVTPLNTSSTRDGFGEGLTGVGKNPNVVVLCGDLKESTKVADFAKMFPERFIEAGIAEQNMASVASGLALSGKIPFVVSHAAFNPARNWDQIRMSVCMNKANVKLVGSHSGFSNGPDGATAEPLEDIAITRVLPNMTVINPIDFAQAKHAVEVIVEHKGPVYLRLSKEPTPQITTEKTPFEIGKALMLTEGSDVTIISCGPITYEVMKAAKDLAGKHGISAEVLAMPTIKPLDEKAILESAKKTRCVVTVEEHQIIGGLGSAVAEVLGEKLPTKMARMGVKDTFGESGTYKELIDKYGLSAHQLVNKVLELIKEK